MRIKVILFFINFNDSYYLPFLAKNYSYCDHVVMYDNHSTDDSVQIAKSLGFRVKTFGKPGELNDQHYLDVKNNCWKNIRCDYTIVCDADEFLFTDKSELEKLYNSRVTVPNVQGYNMVSDHLPVDDIREVSTGAKDPNYSKNVIFNPQAIKEINFVHGCHQNHMIGQIKTGGNLGLYHYRMIGGVQRIIDRHSMYLDRMSKFNHKHGLGIHYKHSEESKQTEWNHLTDKSKKLW